MKNTKVTQAVCVETKRLRDLGMTYGQVASLLNISERTVGYIIKSGYNINSYDRRQEGVMRLRRLKNPTKEQKLQREIEATNKWWMSEVRVIKSWANTYAILFTVSFALNLLAVYLLFTK